MSSNKLAILDLIFTVQSNWSKGSQMFLISVLDIIELLN